MFPDSGLEPLYNTVDASLWYFYAVYKYLEYVATPDAYEFIKKDIYPCLKDIISTYKKALIFPYIWTRTGSFMPEADSTR